MDVLDFNLIVAPLAILVFGLVAAIVIIARRKEIEEKRRMKRITNYLREKIRQRRLLEKELDNLNDLLSNKSINKDTYERLKTLVRMSKEEPKETAEILQ